MYFITTKFITIFTINTHIFKNSVQINIKFTFFVYEYESYMYVYIYIYIYVLSIKRIRKFIKQTTNFVLFGHTLVTLFSNSHNLPQPLLLDYCH